MRLQTGEMRLVKDKIIFPLMYSGGIFAHPNVDNDFAEILNKCDKRETARVHAAFDLRINYLEEHGLNAIQHRQWFEKLKHHEAYYAMRIMCLANVRVIYCFLGQKPILLHAFSEKAHGQARAKSYSSACEKAKARLEYFLRMEDGKWVTIVNYTTRVDS